MKSETYNAAQAEKYGSFWGTADKFRNLGKYATGLDVAVRAEAVANAPEDQRTRVAFEQGAGFIADRVVDPFVVAGVLGSTEGLGALALIPALVATNSAIEPIAKWGGDGLDDIYEWESRKFKQ